MTQKVEFYILDQAKSPQSFLSVCHFIEKAYLCNEKIYVHTDNPSDANQLDALLWTYKDISFLPHEVENSTSLAPIQIGYQPFSERAPCYKSLTLFINLSSQFPELHMTCKIVEIVFKDENLQQSARERYKKYRELNCELNTIKHLDSASSFESSARMATV